MYFHKDWHFAQYDQLWIENEKAVFEVTDSTQTGWCHKTMQSDLLELRMKIKHQMLRSLSHFHMKRVQHFNRLKDEPFSSHLQTKVLQPKLRSDLPQILWLRRVRWPGTYWGCSVGDTFLLQKVLDDGIDVNTADFWSLTALIGSDIWNCDMIPLLLSRGANINKQHQMDIQYSTCCRIQS